MPRKVEESVAWPSPRDPWGHALVSKLRDICLQYGWTINHLLGLIEEGVGGVIIPTGAITEGQVTLTPIDTWKQVPPAGSVPGANYRLHVSVFPENGQLYWSLNGSGTPSTEGLPPKGFDRMDLQGGQAVFFASENATSIARWVAQEHLP